MSTQELKIGIVGCGNISRLHVKGYQRAGGARITQVFDVHRPSAEARAAELEAEVADSLAAMANPAEIDAVSICTPPGTHLESCLPFLEAGIPILCEKPFEATAEGAQQLAAAVRGSKSLFMIAFCHRYNAHVKEAKRLLTEEAELVGEPLFFRNLFGGKIDMNAGHRSNPALAGGGTLIDNCAHSLDLFRFLMGEATTVSAQIANQAQDGPVEDFASIDLQGVGRFAGQISSSYSFPVVYNSVEIYCSKSTITINYWIPGRPGLVLQVQGEGKERAVEVDGSIDQFTGEIIHFLECVRTGARPTPGIDDAVANAHLIEAAYRSAREGQRIAL